MNIVSTGIGKSTMAVVVENDSLSLTVYVSSIGQSVLDIVVYEVGLHDDNKRVLRRLPQYDRAQGDPKNFIIPTGGRIEIEATYNGSVSFEIHGKAVSAYAHSEREVPLPAEGELEHWASNKQLLIDINDNLRKMNNHLRVITGLEAEATDGDF